jgi:type II secretory pathway pseudopilin PulG
MKQHNSQSGFSYIDVMIAITILLVGIMGATAAIAMSMMRSQETDKKALAKQIGYSTLESIFTARDMRRPRALEGWSQIGNIGTNPVNGEYKGMFLTGWTPIRRDPGLDGISGTIDDSCPGSGGCANYDQSFNNSEIVQDFQRKIIITDLETPNRPVQLWGILRRQVDITVRYRVNHLWREEKISTLITRFE